MDAWAMGGSFRDPGGGPLDKPVPVYDEKDAVGRRYRRQDAAGTPLCITVDHQSLEDRTVTVRFRDSMEQQRVAIDEVGTIVHQEVDMKHWLQKMEQA